MSRLGIHPKPAFPLSPSLSQCGAPVLCAGSMCTTGSSFSCEAARRLHCKPITRCQRKCSLQAKWEEAGLHRFNDWQGHKAEARWCHKGCRHGAAHGPKSMTTGITRALPVASCIALRWRWNMGVPPSNKQRHRYAFLMGCIIDCVGSQGGRGLCSAEQRSKNKAWSEKVIKRLF